MKHSDLTEAQREVLVAARNGDHVSYADATKHLPQLEALGLVSRGDSEHKTVRGAVFEYFTYELTAEGRALAEEIKEQA